MWEGDESLIVFTWIWLYLLIRWMNTSRVKYSIMRTYFLVYFCFVVRIMKRKYQYYAIRWECYKKKGDAIRWRKDRLIGIDRCCSSNYYDHLGFKLSQQHQNLEAFGIYGKNFFACFLSFFWLGSLWMALEAHYGKVEKNFLRNYLVEFVFYSWAAGVLFGENFMPSKIPVWMMWWTGSINVRFTVSVIELPS